MGPPILPRPINATFAIINFLRNMFTGQPAGSDPRAPRKMCPVHRQEHRVKRGTARLGLRSLSISSARTPSANSGWRTMLVSQGDFRLKHSRSEAWRVSSSWRNPQRCQRRAVCQALSGPGQPRILGLLRHDVVDDLVNIIAITQGVDEPRCGSTCPPGTAHALLGERPQHMANQRMIAGADLPPVLLQQVLDTPSSCAHWQ